MKLRRHKIQDIPYQPARHIGPVIQPEIVVLHDTASRLDHGNAARYLRDNTRGVSVHFVIERDGSITQQVPTNRRANHAGKSSYHGRDWCNGFSIGIEIVNPGKMSASRPGYARAWWGEDFEIAAHGLQAVTTPEHGAGIWMPYTPEQIVAVEALLAALFDGVPTLKDVRAHWYVSPGRKVDVSPLFPLEQIRARILGRGGDVDDDTESQSLSAVPDESVIVRAPSGLNMRSWPSFNPNVVTSIPDGTALPVLRRGLFAGREWLRVIYAGHEGWIVAHPYTHPL